MAPEAPEVGSFRVIALAWCPRAAGTMVPVDALEVTPSGIPEDRYAEGVGTWSWHRTSPLTVVDAREVAEAARELGVSLDPVALRRNVVVDGGQDLEAWIGRRFRLGDAVLEGERPCHPCRHLEELLSMPGLKAALEDRGGLRVQVLEGGRIRVGDTLREI